MSITATASSIPNPRRTGLTQRLTERRRRAAARREHDQVLTDPRLAGEHRATATHAHAEGLPGCEFCG